ncbi:MAG: hypothetical protein ACXQS8_06740 [Candidatus Helarchaeales archaeon]
MELAMLLWALLLGGLGGLTTVLLKIYNENKWVKTTPKMVSGIALGIISAFLMWLIGDGAYIFGLIAYFLAGATGPSFILELLEKYSKKKDKK